MTKKSMYKGTREVRTFVDLNHSSHVLILKTKENRKGSYHTTMAALLLTAFTFEAYLNHLGSGKIKFWDKIESIRVLDKYEVLCKEFDIEVDFSKRPYQTLKSLFKYRNSIAHGKSQILEKTETVNASSDPYDHSPKTQWEEFCTLKNAERAKEDVEQTITELHEAAGEGAYPFINGMTVSSMKLKKSDKDS